MTGIGYKAFGVSSKDVNAIGQIQTKLTTIEFGFTPFIPFTKRYRMAITEGVASGTDFGTGAGGQVSEDVKQEAKEWIMGPGAEGEPKPGKWAETLQAWKEANYDLQSLVEKQPTNMQRERANLLSDYLSKLFESESITSKYEGTVKGEVMEQSVTDAALNMADKDGVAWKNRGFQTPNTVVDKLTKSGGFSNEQIDLTYIDEFQQSILDYSHHRLAANFGNDAIRGSLGIETTDMSVHKTFQNTLFNEYDRDTIITAKQVKNSVEKDIAKMFDMMNSIGGSLQNQYNQLVAMGAADKKSKKYNHDPHSYTAAQILDRFRKIEASWHQMEENPLYENYIYQMPIGGGQSAYITLTPHFKGSGDDLLLQGISVDARVIDLSDAPDWLKQYFNVPSETKNFAKPFIGLHSNFLLYDMWKNDVFSRSQIEQIARKGSMDAINHLALGIGKAGELVGTSLETETALFPIEALGKAPVVSTVEILGTKEIADSLKLQVLGHFQGAETQIAAWYRDAMRESADLTKEWKKRAKDNSKLDFWGKPYDTETELSRTGTPFFMTMGRDISAYKLFKNKIADRSTWERAPGGPFFDPQSRVLYAPGAMKRSESFNVTPKLQAKYAKAGMDVPLGPRQAFKPNIPKWV